jgi:3-deoxy-D-arabino-heptulosonate 7-phosphate (DAHP) synthase
MVCIILTLDDEDDRVLLVVGPFSDEKTAQWWEKKKRKLKSDPWRDLTAHIERFSTP